MNPKNRTDASATNRDSLSTAFDRTMIRSQQRRCACDECKGLIDVLNDIEDETTNNFALERLKNEELARLNYA